MPTKRIAVRDADHDTLVADVVALIEAGRAAASRSVNVAMTATYWLVGRAIVEREQRGARRAEYGGALLERLANALTARYGRGFSRRNLEQMRAFYLAWENPQAPSALSTRTRKTQTPSALSRAPSFPLPWSQYVRLLSIKNDAARAFYEAEALRGGWTIRQLSRQIESQFYERTALSKNKAAMLTQGQRRKSTDVVSPEEQLKDPFVLEFLDLKDEYSESELEEALIVHLEHFLLELGGDFAFIGRQRRLRVGDVWYRIDLLFFHRTLRCLVVIDLKIGSFTHADAGQMHLYLNYARAHWTRPGENPPVGLILCAEKDDAVARYALEGLPNKVLAAEYRTKLPEERVLVAEIAKTRRLLAIRGGER